MPVAGRIGQVAPSGRRTQPMAPPMAVVPHHLPADVSAGCAGVGRLGRARALVSEPVVNAARSTAEGARADLAQAGSETGHVWSEAARASYREAARLADARHQKV